LQLLLWLHRTPESFVPGHPSPVTPDKILPEPSPDRRLRWDVPALHAALNQKRQERGMTWKQVADEIGGCTPATLTGLATGRHISFPQAMRLVAWLDRPAVSFTVFRVLRSP
jgi:Helix-turn-helix